VKLMLLLAVAAALALAGCDQEKIPTSDQKMNKQQEDLANEAVMQVGMPAITNFQEKRMMKSVIEARDRTIATTTYVFAQNTGQIFKLCDSVGYGLPYATQYTNPMKALWYTRGETSIAGVSVSQADPNGLFSPSQSEATWIFCLDPVTKKDKAVYVEPRVIVAPFPITLTPVEFAKP
jgi:hypothetical protein